MPLIQLEPHLFTSLPCHPSFPDNETRPRIEDTTRSAFLEALEFLNSAPSAFTADPKLRASSPSAAKVKLFRQLRKSVGTGPNSAATKSKPEFWVCRQSEHANSSTDGTASWDEFQEGLRANHAEHEMEYTPSVTSVERLLEWSKEEIGEIEADGVKFHDVDAEVNLITHSFHPGILISPRSFISFTISAAYSHDSTSGAEASGKSPLQGFITIQIPLRSDLKSTPTTLHERIVSLVPRRAVFGNYASVERVALLSSQSAAAPSTIESDVGSDGTHVQWTMATTSDAGGSIPQWVQRSWTLGGVPRAVVADVGLFIGWVKGRRSHPQ